MGYCHDCEKCGFMYDTKYFEWCPKCYTKEDWTKEIAALKSEMADYREALSFYADKSNYQSVTTGAAKTTVENGHLVHIYDHGKLARSVLAKHDKHKGE